MQLFLLALMLSLPLAQETAPASEPSPYANWSNGPSTDQAWFPIGVWLQDPALAERYRELGINTFVGLWQGPTREQLVQLKQAEMSVVCGMNKLAMELADESTIIAWMQEDEPDNFETHPSKLQEAYGRLRARDATRPVFLNLGQGVANDQWKGRRSPREWYPKYAATADIVSFDVYPITNLKRDDGLDFLWYLAKGLRRLAAWTEGKKPLWNLIECTRVHQLEKKPTPAQVESEVWISLINGSKGIVYFCHNFAPKTEAAALLADKTMARAVGAINERVLRYAPMLNAPSLGNLVEVSTGDPEAPVAVMTKRVNGWTYLFCVAMRNRAAKASFTLLGREPKGRIEVLDEKRWLSWSAAGFEDHFEPYAVHLYRFKD